MSPERWSLSRRALDRILRDEVRHRDFGWTLLRWLLTTPGATGFTRLLAAELPSMLRRVRSNYAHTKKSGSALASPDTAEDFVEVDRLWGLMPTSEYADAVTETFRRDYRPRFEALGIAFPQV